MGNLTDEQINELIDQAVARALAAVGQASEAKPFSSHSITSMLADFGEHLRYHRQRKPSTCQDYQGDVERFTKFLTTANVTPQTTDLNEQNFATFIVFLRKKGRSENTVARRAYGLHAFWKFLCWKKLAEKPPTIDELELNIKGTNTIQPILSKEEFEALCKQSLTMGT